VKKRHIQRLLSAAAAMIIATGCAQTDSYEWVMKVNDENVPEEIFVMSEIMAYMEAQTMSDSDDVLTETIEDKTGEQWISDEAVYNVKEYYFINEEFNERGLEISEEDETYLSALADEQWGIVGEYYNNNGVSSEYYKEYLTHLYKEQLIFNDIYLTEEMITQSADEISRYLASNLSRVEAFAVSATNADGTALTDTEYETLLTIAQTARTSIDEGIPTREAVDTVIRECSEQLGFTRAVPDGEGYVSEFFMNISSASYDENFKTFVFSLAENESGIYETDGYVFIVHKLPVAQTDEDYQRLVKQVMYMLKNQEFMRYIRDEISRYEVVLNDQALSFYAPSKIVLTIK